MSKTAKIVLGLVGGAILVAYSIIRIGGQQFKITNITFIPEDREAYCYRGVGSISVLTSPDGCVMRDCNGAEIGYTQLAQAPGNGCSTFGSTEQAQWECTVDNCLAGASMENPIPQEELEKSLAKNKRKFVR